MSKTPKQSDRSQPAPTKIQEKRDAILNLIEPFCREHLNEDYRILCRNLTELLARKRPSPMINGTAAAWACGIVRTIGWVNFLDDPAQQPHMKMTQVDKHFGVSSGTGQAKSKTIRDLLKIRPFDLKWGLPGTLDNNPMAWLVQVNGMVLDARCVPREIQEAAFRRGIIPYIPADQKDKKGSQT